MVKRLTTSFNELVVDRTGAHRNVDASELEAETTLMSMWRFPSVCPPREYRKKPLTMYSFPVNAGSDTTAIQLTNVMYQLLKNPSKLATLRKELDAALKDQGQDQDQPVVVPYAEVKALPYLRACLDEALRITPPVAFGLPRRTPPRGAMIGGTWVPGDVTVCIPAYTAHRDEKWFPDPEAYQPERWLKEDSAKLQSQFIAFSAGARGCLGRNISYLEQTVLFASLLRRYNFSLVDEGWSLERREDFNLLPGNMPVRIKRRT